jgi:hypothetical protein
VVAGKEKISMDDGISYRKRVIGRSHIILVGGFVEHLDIVAGDPLFEFEREMKKDKDTVFVTNYGRGPLREPGSHIGLNSRINTMCVLLRLCKAGVVAVDQVTIDAIANFPELKKAAVRCGTFGRDVATTEDADSVNGDMYNAVIGEKDTAKVTFRGLCNWILPEFKQFNFYHERWVECPECTQGEKLPD